MLTMRIMTEVPAEAATIAMMLLILYIYLYLCS